MSNTTRALPDAMTAALAAALQKADLPSRLPSADQVDGQLAFQVSSLANESQQQLRLLVSEELAQAVHQITSAQVCTSSRFKVGSSVFAAFSCVRKMASMCRLALASFSHTLCMLWYAVVLLGVWLTKLSSNKFKSLPPAVCCVLKTGATLPGSNKAICPTMLLPQSMLQAVAQTSSCRAHRLILV